MGFIQVRNVHLALASLTGAVVATGDGAVAGAARRSKLPHRHSHRSA